MKPLELITVRKAAELAGEDLRTMYRRIDYLDPDGAKGVRVQVGARRYKINPLALLRELRSDPSFAEEELASFHAKLAENETKLLALRQSLRALKKRVLVLERAQNK